MCLHKCCKYTTKYFYYATPTMLKQTRGDHYAMSLGSGITKKACLIHHWKAAYLADTSHNSIALF